MKLQNIIWSATDIVCGKFGQFLITLVLARLLKPEEFGVIAILMMINGFADLLVDSGMSAAILRKKSPSKIELYTAFNISLILALLLYILILALSDLIVFYFNIEELSFAIKIFSFNIIISSLAIIPRTILLCEMKYRIITLITVISTLISGLVGIALAVYGFSYWSIIVMTMTYNVINLSLCLFFTRWIPKFKIDISTAKELFNYAKYILLSGFIDLLGKQSYNYFIGNIYSMKSLGFYYQSEKVASVIILNLTQAFQRVNFQTIVYSGEKNTASTYNRVFNLYLCIFIPLVFFLSYNSSLIVRVLLGTQWDFTSSLFSIMIFGYVFIPLGSISLNLVKISGDSQHYLKVEVAKKIILFIVLYFTYPYGVHVIVEGFVVSSAISFLINIYMCRKYTDTSTIRDIGKFAVCFVVFGIPYLVTSSFVSITQEYTYMFSIVSIVTSITVYRSKILDVL